MKPTHALSGILVAIVLFTSCKKDDDSAATATPSIAGVITSGNWKITYFYHSGDDRTSNFDGYVFTFSSNKTMTAATSSDTVNGTWTIDDDGSNEFHMSIGNSSPLDDLDKGWTVTSQSSSEIRLKDSDTGHTEELHFTKI